MIVSGADVNAADNDGETALSIAVKDRWPMIKLLLDAGADVNAADRNGDTVLIKAAKRLDKADFIKLIKAGADVNAVNNKGMKAIDFASDKVIIKLLKKAGAK